MNHKDIFQTSFFFHLIQAMGRMIQELFVHFSNKEPSWILSALMPKKDFVKVIMEVRLDFVLTCETICHNDEIKRCDVIGSL